jgi:uncharacterized membrane protein
MPEISTFDQLIREAKEYLAAQKEYALLTLVEKLSLLLSAVVVFVVVMLLSLVGFFYLFVALHAWLSPLWGEAVSALVLAGIVVCLTLLVYSLREYIVKRPVLRFVARIFLNPNK